MIRYISKGDWFIEGTEATLIDDYRPQINAGLFSGKRRNSPKGTVYDDEEVCSFDEFIEVPRDETPDPRIS